MYMYMYVALPALWLPHSRGRVVALEKEPTRRSFLFPHGATPTRSQIREGFSTTHSSAQTSPSCQVNVISSSLLSLTSLHLSSRPRPWHRLREQS